MSNGGDKCAFCREPVIYSEEEEDYKRVMKRVKANDPAALRQMGAIREKKGDYVGSFECYTKAAELGDLDAHYRLGILYDDGRGVEKDEEKRGYRFEIAAIGGHPYARNRLGWIEWNSGNTGRAVKHFIIAANLGNEVSMKNLWKCYSTGHITMT
jgi:TPR repeat protein